MSRSIRPAKFRRDPCGVYYAPGSLKARFCRDGKVAMKDFCTEHGIPFELCGN